MNIIFDLDGTLIDSSEAILSAFREALKQQDISPKLPMTAALIGPPLKDLLPELTGISDQEKLDEVAAAFKAIYDNETYLSSDVYEGVDEVLSEFSARPSSLFIATNKREVPTLKIVEHLGWQDYFTGVYSLDSFPELATKKELLAAILHKHQLAANETLYIGDTESDYRAALANALDFVMVQWGYGQLGHEAVPKAATVSQLMRLIDQWRSA